MPRRIPTCGTFGADLTPLATLPRHIDCAWAYKNEAEVGQGIRDSGIDRKELFVTSKVRRSRFSQLASTPSAHTSLSQLWNTFHSPDKVAAGLQETLDNLGLDHLDLYLMQCVSRYLSPPRRAPVRAPRL